MKDIQTVKCKMCWLNVAIENVKQIHSDCKNILVMRDNIIEALGRFLKFSKQGCSNILFESRQREYTLAAIRLKNDDPRKALKWRRDSNDIAKSCLARGGYLLRLHGNALQELLADRDALWKTIETLNFEHSADIEILNVISGASASFSCDRWGDKIDTVQ